MEYNETVHFENRFKLFDTFSVSNYRMIRLFSDL